MRTGDRVNVQGTATQGVIDTFESAPSGKRIVMVDLDNGMTMPAFEEELTVVPDTTYPVPGSVSLLPTIIMHAGTVLYAETDGEFMRASVEFATVLDRALFLMTRRSTFPDVEVAPYGEYQAVGTRHLRIAFKVCDYYL